jgi:effector-binding domain-containing protein
MMSEVGRDRVDDLLPIGRFSRMSRLSIKALRLYDEQALLLPSWVDPASGYRYYRAAQARHAEAIRILRMVDMPLEEIREVLAEDDPALITKRLAMHRERLAARLADQERMLRFLEGLIDRGGTIVPYDIDIKHAPEQQVASVSMRTTLATISASIGEGFAVLMGALADAATPPVGAPFIIYHEVIDEQTEGDVELCIPVTAAVAGSHGHVEFKVIPGAMVAATTHRGPYDEISPAYHTVTGWIQDHGHQIAGPPREIYLNDPQSVLPDDLLTEVQFPIDAPA